MDLLRLTTAGSVDDGKSTLIGRLMVDTKAILEDQYEAIQRASRGDSGFDLALVTDGLRAEREQGITIDVAYRYFATARRKFIVADTPGHEQYTRNMVTGASNAQLSVVLIDAQAGVSRQSRRHAAIASLLRIPHLLVAVNKMDLVDYSELVFSRIVEDFRAFARHLELPDVVFVPISALTGDNVVEKSPRMPWYQGPAMLHHLENVTVAPETNVVDFRLPVQLALRPSHAFRGVAGQIASGSIHRGEPVVVLPSGRLTRVASLSVLDRPVEDAGPGEPVVITFDTDVDVGRGDMLSRPGNRPVVGTSIDADICWMSDDALSAGRTLLLQQTTRRVRARVARIVYRLNVDTLHREQQPSLELNDIGRVEIETASPLCFDAYRVNRRTGSFVLIDPDTNGTVAAGMIRGSVPRAGALDAPGAGEIDRATRERAHGHRAAVVWLTGLSGAGKSTIAAALERRLFAAQVSTARLDGDQMREGLSSDLGFSERDRAENIRRAGAVAATFFEHGCVTICSFVSPYRRDRDVARGMVPAGRFFEVHVSCSIDTCAARDPKGLYRRARAGELADFTGLTAPYESPEHPELVLDTDHSSIAECVDALVAMLERAGMFGAGGA